MAGCTGSRLYSLITAFLGSLCPVVLLLLLLGVLAGACKGCDPVTSAYRKLINFAPHQLLRGRDDLSSAWLIAVFDFFFMSTRTRSFTWCAALVGAAGRHNLERVRAERRACHLRAAVRLELQNLRCHLLVQSKKAVGVAQAATRVIKKNDFSQMF